MINLLKAFGRGILYVIGLPFFLVALAIFGAIGLIAFIFQIIKSIIFFFTGQKFFPELPEDKELRLMQEAANAPAQPVNNGYVPQEETQSIITPIKEEPLYREQPVIQPVPEPTPAPAPAPSIEEACFNEPTSFEEKIEEELGPTQEQEPVYEEPAEEKHTVLETANDVQEESDEEEFEELETYVPRSSNYSSIDDDDEDDNDTHSGVDINYDL